MRHVAAALLLVLGGNSKPSADQIKSVLESVGAESNDDTIAKLLSQMEDKEWLSTIDTGFEKIKDIAIGGSGGGPSTGGSSGGATEAVEEEEEEEEEEEMDLGGGMDMFGDDGGY